MTAPRAGLSFVTHGEIEGLLGGGPSARQQRRRLTKRGLLPEPIWVRSDRQRLGIFPEFALASLVVPIRSLKPQHLSLLASMVKDATKLYESRSCNRLRGAIKLHMREVDPACGSGALLNRLTESHRDILDEWRVDVATVAELLSRQGLKIEADPGRIVAIQGGTYLLESLEAGLTESHPLSDAPCELPDGSWVVRDRVHALSSARDFILPTSKPELAKETSPALPVQDGDEAMFEEMFAPFKTAPRPVRRLPVALDDETLVDAPEAPPPLVGAPLELLEGFTPMTRPRV